MLQSKQVLSRRVIASCGSGANRAARSARGLGLFGNLQKIDVRRNLHARRSVTRPASDGSLCRYLSSDICPGLFMRRESQALFLTTSLVLLFCSAASHLGQFAGVQERVIYKRPTGSDLDPDTLDARLVPSLFSPHSHNITLTTPSTPAYTVSLTREAHRLEST